jgi:glycine C-acetyltransferase
MSCHRFYRQQLVKALLGKYGQVDIITGTLGKALGGQWRLPPLKKNIELLRQRSRPYLFSIHWHQIVGASIKVLNY